MNLHALVGPAVSTVNPSVIATVKPSTGSTKDAAFKKVPTYGTPFNVTVQMQPLTFSDLRQIDGLNLQGEKRAMYLTGNCSPIVRQDGSGGDLITLPDASVWLNAMILENFYPTSGWIKLVAVRQMPS